VASGNPPQPEVACQIEYSTDQGATWNPVVKDWRVPRQGREPADFWSQSFCYGSAELKSSGREQVRVRFSNNARKGFLRAEMHLVYQVNGADTTGVTFSWTDNLGRHQAQHSFVPAKEATWVVPTGRDVQTDWVEFTAVPGQ
jgi:hypothetical protein